MKIYHIMNFSKLRELIEKGYIDVNRHPEFPLEVLDYSRLAEFDQSIDWGEELNICRGLIVNYKTNEIVARPYRKFWNLGDERHPETLPENLPQGVPLFLDKLDGSMGTVYEWEGKIYVATRGSLSSDQAIWATNWFAENVPNFKLPDGYTVIVEIIYPENRIVCNYDFAKCIVTGAVNIETGVELPRKELEAFCANAGIEIVQEFSGLSIESAVAEDIENREGYVVTYPNGLKVKVKYATYCRLHKIMTNFNDNDIIELLSIGDIASIEEILNDEFIPKEYRDAIYNKVIQLRNIYDVHVAKANQLYNARPIGAVQQVMVAYFKQFPDYYATLYSRWSSDNSLWSLSGAEWKAKRNTL